MESATDSNFGRLFNKLGPPSTFKSLCSHAKIQYGCPSLFTAFWGDKSDIFTAAWISNESTVYKTREEVSTL